MVIQIMTDVRGARPAVFAGVKVRIRRRLKSRFTKLIYPHNVEKLYVRTLILYDLSLIFTFHTGIGTMEAKNGPAGDSLPAYIRIAAANNPMLQSTYARYEASLMKIPQAGSLPDPEFTAGYFIRPMELPGGNERAEFRLMQMFPWAGTLRVSKEEESEMSGVMFQEFSLAAYQLTYNVKKEWYDLYRISKEITLEGRKPPSHEFAGPVDSHKASGCLTGRNGQRIKCEDGDRGYAK